MKLAVIYNVWDGVELLPGSIKSIRESVDEIIIVYQDISNYGEPFDPLPFILENIPDVGKIRFIHFTPNIRQSGALNEKAKRNLGLESARVHGCTHFIHMDCDEYYMNFELAVTAYRESGARGSVCKLFTYFKKPTLRFENADGYYVPFIHKLQKNTMAGVSEYPFWADPTRRINEENVIELPIFMHHFSWVRLDIERKCRNSSARKNIARGTMLESYNSYEIGPGFFVKDYQQKLIQVSDHFNLSEIFN